MTYTGDGRFCVLQHMLAGAVAGTLEHTLMFPIDTIKTRMQALSHPGQQACSCLLPSVQRCMLAWPIAPNCVREQRASHAEALAKTNTF